MTWTAGNTNSSTTSSITLAVTAGQLIVAFVACNGTAAAVGCSDNVNGAYVLALFGTSNRPASMAIFYTVAATTATVTITGTSDITVEAVHAAAFSHSAGDISGSINDFKFTISVQTVNLTTSINDTLVVGFGDGSTTNNAGSGFTTIAQTVANIRATSEYQTALTNSAGTQTTAFSMTTPRGTMAVAFNPPGVPGWVPNSAVEQEVAPITGTTHTFALNAGTMAGRTAIVICEYSTGAASISGMTYGGAAMTSFAATVNNAGGLGTTFKLRCFYLANAPSGSNNVVMTFGATGNIRYTAAAFRGCDTTAPVTNQASGTGANGAVSVTVTSAVGEFAAMLGQAYANSTAISTQVPAAGVRKLFYDDGSASSIDNWAGYLYARAGAASAVLAATLSVNTPTDWFAFAFSLKGPTAAAGAAYRSLIVRQAVNRASTY